MVNINFRRLYNAAVKLQIIGPTQRLLRKRNAPADLYEFFKIPKHLSIMLRLDLKVLYKQKLKVMVTAIIQIENSLTYLRKINTVSCLQQFEVDWHVVTLSLAVYVQNLDQP